MTDIGHHGGINWKDDPDAIGDISKGFGQYAFNWPFCLDNPAEVFGMVMIDYPNALGVGHRCPGGQTELCMWSIFVPGAAGSATYKFNPVKHAVIADMAFLDGVTITVSNQKDLYVTCTVGYLDISNHSIAGLPGTIGEFDYVYFSGIHPGRPNAAQGEPYPLDSATTVKIDRPNKTLHQWISGRWEEINGVEHSETGFFVAIPKTVAAA